MLELISYTGHQKLRQSLHTYSYPSFLRLCNVSECWDVSTVLGKSGLTHSTLGCANSCTHSEFAHSIPLVLFPEKRDSSEGMHLTEETCILFDLFPLPGTGDQKISAGVEQLQRSDSSLVRLQVFECRPPDKLILLYQLLIDYFMRNLVPTALLKPDHRSALLFIE